MKYSFSMEELQVRSCSHIWSQLFVTRPHVMCNSVASGLFGQLTRNVLFVDIDSEQVHSVIAAHNGELTSSITYKQSISFRYATTV